MRVLVVGKPGRLSNRLFYFAHFIAFACEHGARIAFPGFLEYSRYYSSTERDALCCFPPCKRTRKASLYVRTLIMLGCFRVFLWIRRLWPLQRFIPIHQAVEQEILLGEGTFLQSVREKPLVIVEGWRFRDRKNLEKHAERVRQFFRPLPVFERNAQSLLSAARSRAKLVIGVHVRQGDYAEWAGGRFFYSLAHYRSVMEQVRRLFKEDVIFVIASADDFPEETFAGLNWMPSTGHLIEDQHVLAGCDFLIGPPSTYSAWAAYVGQVRWLCLRSASIPIVREEFKTLFEVWDDKYLQATWH